MRRTGLVGRALTGALAAIVGTTALATMAAGPAAAAPPKPVGLVATPTAIGISLNWDDVSAPDVAGYRITRDLQPLTPDLVTASSYTDSTAELGIVYAYYVAAVDVLGGASDPAIVFAKRPSIPFAAFSVSAPPPPTLPAIVTFTDQSSGEPTAWAWDFQSDGVVDKVTQNPTFTYTSSGTYTVTLTVSNVSGTDSTTRTLIAGSVDDGIPPPKPVGLVATPTASGISLNWDDVSAPDVAGYRITRDGQVITPTLVPASSFADPNAVRGIVHAYGVAAVDVWDHASDPAIVFAKRPAIPGAAFLVSLPPPSAGPATVAFTDVSSGEPTAWAWDFQGDGAVDATTPNSTFTYPSPGIYTVSLTVSNMSGTDNETRTVVVSADSGGGPGNPGGPGSPGGPGGPGDPLGPGDPGVVCGSDGPWAVGMPAVRATTFHPVTPGRILDTRDGTGAPAGKLGAGCTLALDVTGRGGIPAAGVLAVSLNVTATEASEDGFVTVYPCAAGRPTTSSLNTGPDRDIANLVTVPAGADGLVCFYTYRSVHLLADVAGWFGDGGSRMTGLAPARVLDTRDGTGAPASAVAAGGVVSVPVAGWGGVPATGVSAVVLNLTATESAGRGYLSAYPCDQEVYASALNYVAGHTVANHVVVPLDSAGRFCISSYAESHVIADVLGYYGDPGDPEGSRFTPLTPSRIVDTRSDLPAGARRVDAANMLPLDVLGNGGVPTAGVDAVMFNLTSADAAGPGYLTAFPCGGAPPNASNVNHVASAAASNLVTVPLGTSGQVCVFSYAGSDVLVDLAGYFSP